MANITNISVNLSAGQTYTIMVPVNMSNNMGYFPRRGNITLENGETITFQQGFYVENEEVGEIVTVHSDKVAIDYKYKLPEQTSIWFVAHTGERARIIISSMQVHDHASIVTGGPAYSTYFSDTDAPEESI